MLDPSEAMLEASKRRSSASVTTTGLAISAPLSWATLLTSLGVWSLHGHSCG